MERSNLLLPERGVTLSLLDWGGDGPLAILTHANGFCGALFAPVAERLRAHYRVVAFDARGHGNSTVLESPDAYRWPEFIADWVAVAEAMCARFDRPSVALGVGHSLGGACLIAAATMEPALFDQIVALDPVVIPPKHERTGHYAGEFRHPMAAAALKRRDCFPSRDIVRKSWAARGVFADWDSRVLDLYLEHGFRGQADGTVKLACPPAVEAAAFDLGPHFDLHDELPRLCTRATWLWAAKGNFPRELVARAAALAPCVELESMDVGHLIPMIAPDEVASTLLRIGGA